MRIYVLVTSCDPLRIFLYNDGLLRMGTEHYTHPSEQNIVSKWMDGIAFLLKIVGELNFLDMRELILFQIF